MPTLEQTNQQAANLYWLAFLLTGNRDTSVDATVQALDSSDGNPFFSAWMMAWSRKVVIAKALAAIRIELAASAQRIAAARSRKCAPSPSRNRALESNPTKVELERALLAIDAFPRCVLLLSLFEGLSLDDATVLLDVDRDLVRKAQAFALEELTHNLAGLRDQSRA
jgi:DNA-directed RNA polymerase specialized sigma24 family protein